MRDLRPVALALTALLLLDGCTRFQVRASPPQASGPAGVELRVYDTDADRSEGDVYEGAVDLELWRQHGDHWELVHRGGREAMGALQLPAGTWKVVVTGIQRDGQMVPLQGRQERRFTVADGQQARLDLTVRSVPWEALIVVTVVVVTAVVVTAVVVSAAGGGGKGFGGFGGFGPPAGPVVTPGSHVPALHASLTGHAIPLELLVPDPDFVNVVVNVGFEFPLDLPYEGGEPPEAHIEPAHGANDPIVIRFDERLDPRTFGPDTMVLVGGGGAVPCGVYSPDRGETAVIHPLFPLDPGSYQLVVDGARVTARDGTPIGRGSAVRFVVP